MTSIFNVQFVTKRGTDFQPSILKKDQNAKNMVMDIFLVLWSYLSTTELSCLQKNIFWHTNIHVLKLLNLGMYFDNKKDT